MDRIKLYGLCAGKGSNGRGIRYKYYFKVRFVNFNVTYLDEYEYSMFKHFMTNTDYITLKIYKLSYQCYLSH